MKKLSLLCVMLVLNTSLISAAALPKIIKTRAFTFPAKEASVDITGYYIQGEKIFVDILATLGKSKIKIAAIRYFELDGKVTEGVKFKYTGDMVLVNKVLQEIREYAESFQGKQNIEILLGLREVIR